MYLRYFTNTQEVLVYNQSNLWYIALTSAKTLTDVQSTSGHRTARWAPWLYPVVWSACPGRLQQVQPFMKAAAHTRVSLARS